METPTTTPLVLFAPPGLPGSSLGLRPLKLGWKASLFPEEIFLCSLLRAPPELEGEFLLCVLGGFCQLPDTNGPQASCRDMEISNHMSLLFNSDRVMASSPALPSGWSHIHTWLESCFPFCSFHGLENPGDPISGHFPGDSQQEELGPKPLPWAADLLEERAKGKLAQGLVSQKVGGGSRGLGFKWGICG